MIYSHPSFLHTKLKIKIIIYHLTSIIIIQIHFFLNKLTNQILDILQVNGFTYAYCDLRQIGGFLRASSSNKADRHDIAEIFLNVVLNTINPTLKPLCIFQSLTLFLCL